MFGRSLFWYVFQRAFALRRELDVARTLSRHSHPARTLTLRSTRAGKGPGAASCAPRGHFGELGQVVDGD